jgi:ubiquinone/menaquinone biosynthesis C-methylase UbiE
MMLSAHLRGFATIWNAGIGDTAKVAELLGVPTTFEIQGALAIGRARSGAPDVNPPRRPLADVRSWERFVRPAASLYPVKPAESYPFFAIRNRDNPFAVWDPQAWGWERLSDFRGYAVWNKSPLAAAELRPRDEDRMLLEVAALPDLPAGARIVDLLPWDGVTTALLRRRFGERIHLHIAELSAHNHGFIAEHLRQEHLSCSNVHFDNMIAGGLPYADASCDAVVASHALEHTPVPESVLDELRRVTKPDGTVLVSVRNSDSRATARYHSRLSKAQVPNAGPWRPLSARVLKEHVRQRFGTFREFGIEADEIGVARRREGRYADKAPVYVVLASEPSS